MTQLADEPCIAWDPQGGDPHLYTVAEYDRLRTAGAIWTRGTPPVEQLSSGGAGFRLGRVRICDPEAYDLQMRKLLGIL